MTNIISELQESNKKLIEENENLKKQLADKDQEINELKNPWEVSEQEEIEFMQEAIDQIHQILVDISSL